MDFKFLLGISCFLMAGVGLIEAEAPPGPVVSQMIKPRVEKYLAFHRNMLDIKLREDPTNPTSGGLKEGMNSNRKSFTHHSESEDGKIFITIGFSKEVQPSSTVQDLQSTLKWVSLDKVPLPCFRYPQGWDIYPMTSRSSFKDGVTIVSYQNGRLHFKVDTMFFAIYGRMSDWAVAADERTPNFAYFQIRKEVRGYIDVNMPLEFA